ncbi:MAG TPA: SdiA-regulated domain-containing protein, partial [Hanamia sp.]|nr:SdiA-regulated domain-containing protein [Hanamia sp.]
MHKLTRSILIFSIVISGCNSGIGSADKKPVIIRMPPRMGKLVSNVTTDSLQKSLVGYDLKKPVHSWELEKDLQEVSGDTWVDKNYLIAIEDLHGRLYLLKLDDKNATVEKKIDFHKTKGKFDIEDVTMVGNTVYAIWSHGDIYKIENWDSDDPKVTKYSTSLSKDNNTEGLCYDPVTKNLLIACKGASGVAGAKKSDKAVYQFSMQTKMLYRKPFLLIHKDDFKKFDGDKLDFNPSAIAIQPISHNIYLLSTKDNKCMAVYNREGKLIGFQKIDNDMMEQPEGMTFSPDGKLYISTEGKGHD